MQSHGVFLVNQSIEVKVFGMTANKSTVFSRALAFLLQAQPACLCSFLHPIVGNMAFCKSFERPAGIYIQPEGFTDISADAYYYDAVQWAVDQEITTGTSDLTFGPDDTCTRAQAVTFLWRAAGAPAPSDDRNPFRDVGADAYYHDAVLWAVENGITSGTGDAVFSPDESCSRAQIVTFLYRQAGSPSVGGGSFTDVQPDSYYAPAVRWAVAQDITSGTSGTTFSPESDCTRAQIVTFLYRDAEM